MHITLTGNLGSGKSTICKILRDTYGFEIYSTGTAQRKIAEEKGISVLEMNELMCRDHSFDHLIDETTARLSKENVDKNIVFDSRLAWNFVEKSFKVFLSVSIDEASRRVYADSSRGQVETYKSIEDCKANLIARAANEDKRYEDIYGIHYFDFNNYDLILDSSYTTPEILAATIVKLANEAEKGDVGRRVLFSPQRLGVAVQNPEKVSEVYPGDTVSIRKTSEDFEAVDGVEVLVAASKAGCPFVDCVLVG